MKPFKSIFVLLGIVLCSSFTTNKNTYPEKIDWDTHFRATPDFNSNYAAVTSTTWHYGYTAKMSGRNLQIDFNFLAGVDPNKSWVNKRRIKDRKTSEALLKHEQGHVYINFLLLKNGETLIRNQNYNINNFKSLISRKAKEVSKYYNDMQDRYDYETKHGLDDTKQAEWDTFFEDELAKVIN